MNNNLDNIKFLDCTIRDGGFYNAWDFDIELVKRAVESLKNAGIDIIELGYKTDIDGQWAGAFRYCNEPYLEDLRQIKDIEYAFMLDVKDFSVDGKFNRALAEQLILPAHESIFTWCRLASGQGTVELIQEMIGFLRANGYRVCVNLMGISLLTKEQKQYCFEQIVGAEPDVFYFADSFGSMYPKDIIELVAEIRQLYDGPLGFHAHDNQGMAFANVLAAIEVGVTFVDSTITGMGRGAGNLATEQLLLWASENLDRNKYRANELLGIIEDYFGPEKVRCGWGHNYVYMLSGLKNIHPSYCMNISEGNKFSMRQISTILDQIPVENRRGFSKDSIDLAVNRSFEQSQDSNKQEIPIFSYQVANDQQSSCLIIAKGQDVSHYRHAIHTFIAQKQLGVFECNDTGVLSYSHPRWLVLLNEMRLKEALIEPPSNHIKVITGAKSCYFPYGVDKISHFPYELGGLSISKEQLQIPDFEAGEYVIALAMMMGFTTIYLAGFSGYLEESKNTPMSRFFKLLGDKYPKVSVIAITPTAFEHVQQKSIYTL